MRYKAVPAHIFLWVQSLALLHGVGYNYYKIYYHQHDAVILVPKFHLGVSNGVHEA